jgi:manganese/zinc/iron transport system permease protein
MFNLVEGLMDTWSTHEQVIWNLQIVFMGIMVSLSCGLVGCFVVVRRMALLGDAVSHGILPGIVIAYLLTGSLSVGPIWIGACIAGLGCGACIEWLRTKTPLREDAAMGLTFTSFFALGIVLLSLEVGQVHLDPACILYGEIGLTPLAPELELWGLSCGNQALWNMGMVCIATMISTVVFYRFLLVTSFDTSLARSLGMPVAWIQYGLMFLLALVVVASFESVGVILVLAMMVLPPVSSSFLFRRLPNILLSCLPLSILYSLGGLHLAYWMNFPISASMAITGVVIFFPCCLFGTKRWNFYPY